jgi:flagellar P-ring protein precursor FlgI
MSRFHQVLVTAAALLLAILTFAAPVRAEKLRALVLVGGARDNQIIGYGIVAGLACTGDNIQVPLAQQSLASLMNRLGIKVDMTQVQLKNVAAVIVTATLPPFAKNGTHLDITVTSTGNARSIVGGTLLQTLLKGADQNVYAVAQGNMIVGGYSTSGHSGSSQSQGVTTSGRVPEGALVERELKVNLVTDGKLKLELRSPSFAMAQAIVDGVNKKLGGTPAMADDSGAVFVKVPSAYDGKPVELIALLEDLEVSAPRSGKVVLNEKTGTIVASGDVRVKPAAIMHGGLTIVIKEVPIVSQPLPGLLGGGAGTTKVVPRTDVEVKEHPREMVYLPGAATLSDVASALSALGLTPREMTSVLQALRSAGALEAEVQVQ